MYMMWYGWEVESFEGFTQIEEVFLPKNEKFWSKTLKEFFKAVLREEELREFVEENYINIYLDLYYLYCQVLSENSHTQTTKILFSLESAAHLSSLFFL